MTSNVLRDLPFSGDQPMKPAADLYRYAQFSFGKQINKMNKARIMDTVTDCCKVQLCSEANNNSVGKLSVAIMFTTRFYNVIFKSKHK
jgi:hypothetical protein